MMLPFNSVCRIFMVSYVYIEEIWVSTSLLKYWVTLVVYVYIVCVIC